MKIKFDTKALKKAVATCSKVVVDTSPSLAMQGILFDASSAGVIATATGDGLSMQTPVDQAVVEEPGQFLLNAKVFNDILKSANGDTLTIENDQNRLLITVGKARYHLSTEKASNFPSVSFAVDGAEVKMDKNMMTNIVNHVAFAAAATETRPILTGVHFRNSDEGLVAEATDSFRLAQEVYPMMPAMQKVNVTIPANTLRMLPTLFNDEVNFHIGERVVLFEDGNTYLRSSILDGGYPSVSNFFPSDFDYEMKVDRLDVLGALNRTKFIKNDGLSIAHLEMTSTGSVLKNKNQELGESSEDVAITVEKGENLTTNFSIEYLADALNAFSDEEYVLMKSIGDMKPFVFQSYGKDSVSMRQLILPVRTYY